jgi:hypothetical protein
MPGLGPGIHVLFGAGSQDVDGRDKPGHDDAEPAAPLWTFVICDSPAFQGRVNTEPDRRERRTAFTTKHDGPRHIRNERASRRSMTRFVCLDLDRTLIASSRACSMELRSMRSAWLALIANTCGAVCAAAQDGKPSWHADSSENKATFVYGIHGTDAVGFYVSCSRDDGSIEVIPGLKEVGLKQGGAEKVGLSTRDDRVELEGTVFLNEETRDNNIRLKAKSFRALGRLFLKAGVLTVTLPNDRYTLPIGPRAIASFASFKKDCSRSDAAAAGQK